MRTKTWRAILEYRDLLGSYKVSKTTQDFYRNALRFALDFLAAFCLIFGYILQLSMAPDPEIGGRLSHKLPMNPKKVADKSV